MIIALAWPNASENAHGQRFRLRGWMKWRVLELESLWATGRFARAIRGQKRGGTMAIAGI